MNPIKLVLSAVTVATMIASAPALAGEERTEPKTAPESSKKGAAQESTKKAPQKPGDQRSADLVRCKTDASGMKGPERGSFMTECLSGK